MSRECKECKICNKRLSYSNFKKHLTTVIHLRNEKKSKNNLLEFDEHDSKNKNIKKLLNDIKIKLENIILNI
jgi:hypothetical protein